MPQDHTGKKLDLSFVGYLCFPTIKANRAWQEELLNSKTVCMIEAISLVTAIFWELNFLLYLKHILKLAKKLRLKMKNLKAEIVKE